MKAFAKLVNEWSPLLMLLTLIVGAVAVPAKLQGNIGNRLDVMQMESNRRYDELNRRIDELQTENIRRFDAAQAENNRRFDAAQAENNRRFDAAQAENNQKFDEVSRRFDEVIRRFDTAQTEDNRRHDEVLEVLRNFEGRISRLEERMGSE